ncbi:MAG TPA: hypothetical protein VJ570_03245 [Holophagaceae bacterium]|nr:hypothetical protein [Holophagaceae bacterium]
MSRPTLADPATHARLVQRLQALRPDSPRRWGTLTAHEMLCHVADAADAVLDQEAPRPAVGARPLVKWIALRSGLPWPKGFRAPARIDQRKGGTPPGDFEADRLRAVDGLAHLAAAPDHIWPRSHKVFGTMEPADWLRWAFRHTDHHLRQFGL